MSWQAVGSSPPITTSCPWGRLTTSAWPVTSNVSPQVLAKAVAEHLAAEGLDTYGDVVVSLERNEALHTGQFKTRSSVDPDARPQAPVHHGRHDPATQETQR